MSEPVNDLSDQVLADELKCRGIEIRDHVDRIKVVGRRSKEEIALAEIRLDKFRAAYRRFLELTGAKP